MKRLVLIAALCAAAAQQPGWAAGKAKPDCYSPSAIEAEQAIRFLTDVMVVSSTCQDTVYAEFRLRNRDPILAYQKAMIAHFHGAPAFDSWNTSLANQAASKRAGVLSTLVCQQSADLLKQALLNVLQNGAQAMPEGGPLKVKTWRGNDGSACITITDRGVGISPEARDRIFNLFYTTKKGGTGIGLAQAFRAVQLHNGTIRFASEVGVGTSFEIVLPAMS